MTFSLVLVALIALNAYFSAAEIAFVSLPQYRLQQAADQGGKSAAQLLRLLKNPDQYLSSIQVGVTLVGIVEGLYGGRLLQQYLEPHFIEWRVAPSLAHFLSLLIGIGGITYLTIVLGELLPKSIALALPQRVALALVPSFRLFNFLAYPLVGLLTGSTRFLLQRLNVKGRENQNLTDEDLKGLLSLAYRQGTLVKKELELHENVFRFYNETIGHIMTPATRIVAVQSGSGREAAEALLRGSTHMFYPVLDAKGQPLGYLSAKEFFMHPGYSIEQLTLTACLVLEEQTVPDLLEQFKHFRYNFGIVVNRKGTFMGVVTMHDVGALLIGDFA